MITVQPIPTHGLTFEERTSIRLRKGHTPVTVREIIRVTAEVHNLRVADMMCRARLNRLVDARSQAMQVARECYGFSLPRIGVAFGYDHSTVHHNLLRLAERRMGNERDLIEQQLAEIKLRVQALRPPVTIARAAPATPPTPAKPKAVAIDQDWRPFDVSRAMGLYRRGWSPRGLARYFGVSEEQVRATIEIAEARRTKARV